MLICYVGNYYNNSSKYNILDFYIISSIYKCKPRDVKNFLL